MNPPVCVIAVVDLTETTNNNVFAFTMDQPTIFTLVAGALLLASGVLTAVALGAEWASYDITVQGNSQFGLPDQRGQGRYETFEVDGIAYSDGDLDGRAGIGMLRAGGPLVLTGMIVAFVTMAGLFASSFLTPRVVRGITIGLGAVATVLIMLGAILTPLGIGDFHSEAQAQLSFSNAVSYDNPVYGAGLILVSIAAALALIGVALAGFSLRSTPADSTTSG